MRARSLLPTCLQITLLSIPCYAQVEYSIVDLGVPPGGGSVIGTSMNEFGDVVGWYMLGSAPHAFHYTDQQGIVDLGVLAGETGSHAFGLNDLGDVVGQSGTRSFSWSQSTGMVEILAPAWTRPNAINTSGQIAGTLNPDALFTRAPYLFDPNTGLTPLTPGLTGRAADINEHGQIAGHARPNVGFSGPGAFRYSPVTGVVALPQLAGFGLGAFPTAINERGDIVGLLRAGVGSDAGFVYTDAGGIAQLTGPTAGVPSDINDHGVIVGSYYLSSGPDNAVIYTQTLGARNLNALVPPGSGYDLLGAKSINNSGQILIYAYDMTGFAFRALRLDPITRSSATRRIGTGCSSGLSVPELTTNAPVVGSLLTFDVSNAPSLTVGLLGISFGVPSSNLLSGSCTAFWNTSNLLPVAGLTTSATGHASLSVPLPAGQALVGWPFVSQVALTGTPSPLGFDLTNAHMLILGN